MKNNDENRELYYETEKKVRSKSNHAKKNNYGLKDMKLINFLNCYFNPEHNLLLTELFSHFNFTHEELRDYLHDLKPQLRYQRWNEETKPRQDIINALKELRTDITVLKSDSFQKNRETHERLKELGQKKRQFDQMFLNETTSLFCRKEDIKALNYLCHNLRRIHTDRVTKELVLKGIVVAVTDDHGKRGYYLVPERSHAYVENWTTMEQDENQKLLKKE